MIRRLALVLVLAAAPGCGAAPKEDTLTESIRSYNDGVRWERYTIAAAKILPKQRGEFVDEKDQLADDLHITDYDIVRVEAKGDREARVQIKVTWYRDSEGVVRDTTAVQTWERHGKAWFMVDETRQRGAEMPGLVNRDEPAPDPAAGPVSATDAASRENH